jgi:c(7)-type cytochrome triheme protein
MNKTGFIAAIIIVVTLFIALSFEHSHAAMKKRPPHHEYGNVVINNFSEKREIAPVVFNHWLHRSRYTCRLCHEDLGFSMKRNGTKITESTNEKGRYCGACHNAKEAFGAIEKGQSSKIPGKNCDRCHSSGSNVPFEKKFYTFTKEFPRARFGNGINWIRAEKEGHLKLKDTLKGVSGKKVRQASLTDSVINPDEPEMPGIIFSHDNHALWNGCKLCHPEPFAEKKGSPKFTMEEVIEGKFCGTCHGKVAFPILDCQRCHTEPTILGR